MMWSRKDQFLGKLPIAVLKKLTHFKNFPFLIKIAATSAEKPPLSLQVLFTLLPPCG